MPELESIIERRLIDQLCREESQWTYRPDIKTEDQLWENFKYILEQNNKAKLDNTPLVSRNLPRLRMTFPMHHFTMQGNGWLEKMDRSIYIFREGTNLSTCR